MRRIAPVLLALLALLLAPTAATAGGPGSVWDLDPVPDRQYGGFWTLGQHWHPEDGVELVLHHFDHDGLLDAGPTHVAPGETWRTGIATAPGGEILIVWWDGTSDRFQTRWADVGGNLGATTTIEADSGWGKPSIGVDPLTAEFVVVWNAQTAGWQTWVQRVSNVSGAHVGAPTAAYSGWGGVEPNDARLAFDEDGNALLVTSAGSGIYSTVFGPGMVGDGGGPRQIVGAGLAPGKPTVAWDKQAGMWFAAWTGWSGPAHVLGAWLDATGAATQLTLDQGTETRGAPSVAAAFGRTWVTWFVQQSDGQIRVDGLSTTGPGDVGSIENHVAQSADQLSTPRLGFNPTCPNLTLFMTRHLALDEPELISLQREDPCPPEEDDDDAADDDDSGADDDDAATDDDDDGGDDDDDGGGGGGGRSTTCGSASAAAARTVGPGALAMLALLSAVGLARRR